MTQMNEAMVTVQYGGQQGDMGPIPFDATDAEVYAAVRETLQHGGVRGIDAIDAPRLDGYVIDRFAARDELPNRITLRPQTPFGS